MDTNIKKIGGGFLGGAYAVAVGLLFLLVLRSIATQIAPPPSPVNEPYPDISTQEKCSVAGGRWVTVSQDVGGKNAMPVAPNEKPQPYCQGPLSFERARDIQSEKSTQVSLFVFAIGGALAVASSAFMRQIRVLPVGLVLGGIVSFFISITQLWMLSAELMRLVTVIALFVLVLVAGWYGFREKEKTA
ncbi:MAG: hypothetical protein Q7S57_04935 [bacterium]|nr:hypothetical protein [bacterium]